MNEQERKERLKQTFDTVSEGYDSRALRFFPESARNLATILELQGNELVLDVAAGTGSASLAIARILQGGKVTGVDFSAGMLAQARAKARQEGLGNTEFIEMDMQDLQFEDNHFDAAVCAFGIFFVEDMERQLAHIAAKVRPGGKVAVSGFHEDLFTPIGQMFLDRIQKYGVEIPPMTWKRMSSVEKCRRLFEEAGLKNVCADIKNVGYFLKDADEWWNVIWYAGFRGMVSQLSPNDLKRFREEHLGEVAKTGTSDGIWLDVEVIYASGIK